MQGRGVPIKAERRRVTLLMSLMLLVACAAPLPSSSLTPTSTVEPVVPSGLASPPAPPTPTASPGTTSPPGTANADRPLTATELADVLVAVQATGDSATVVADVSLTPIHEACEAPAPCPFGTIALPGLDPVPVTADKDVRALFPGATAPIAGPLATQLGGDVALLGVVTVPGGKLVVPVGSTALPGADKDARGAVFAVTGWLVQTLFSCPTMPSLPPDSPFQPCGASYITFGPHDAEKGAPFGATQLQASAYETFAADPACCSGSTSESRQGTYLIRQVKDPRLTCSANCYGWLMVGRLDPIQ